MRRTIAGGIGALFLLFFTIWIASAHYNTGRYIYADGGATQKDPMNVTFYNNATWGNSVTHVEHHLGWTNATGSDMWFWDHDAFRKQHTHRASGCGICNRNHMRFRQGEDADATWGTYTAAAVHYERLRWCGHVATDFDGPRNNVVNAFKGQPGHGDELWANNNNTDPSPQCDGTQPRSLDGKTAWLRIP